jgi:hypothetical protein
MIRIAITIEAFDVICATLPLGSVAYEAETNAKGERLIWIERVRVDKLGAMRGAGRELLGGDRAAGGGGRHRSWSDGERARRRWATVALS